MQGLTKAECSQWCSGLNLVLPSTSLDVGITRYEIAIPKDAGRRIVLARYLWSTCVKVSHKESMLWITEWGVWPSCEHMPLFIALRERFDEKRTVMEAPGCLFATPEDDGLSFLSVASLFLWDVWLYSD